MPILTSPDGTPYRTDSLAEINRLRARGYALGEERPPTVADEQFHPGDHKVKEVLTYVEEHPEEADRIRAEEKAGQARVTITGSED